MDLWPKYTPSYDNHSREIKMAKNSTRKPQNGYEKFDELLKKRVQNQRLTIEAFNALWRKIEHMITLERLKYFLEKQNVRLQKACKKFFEKNNKRLLNLPESLFA
jgi:hypothetical protein